MSPANVAAALPSVAVTGDGVLGVLYDTFDGPSTDGVPLFSAHLARSADKGQTFSDSVLEDRFPSPEQPNPAADVQRVLGDYQQLKAVGNVLYGAFAGNRLGFTAGTGRSVIDPVFFTARGAQGTTPPPTSSSTTTTNSSTTTSSVVDPQVTSPTATTILTPVTPPAPAPPTTLAGSNQPSPGVIPTATVTTTTPRVSTRSTLSTTGAEVARLVLLGAGAIGLGTVLVTAFRRRRSAGGGDGA
ncbi:MAG: hypothetical protein LC792_16880 [Actinobacteria bacterium]|nr:hypothetical protein [Actinomycetota bacterium]